MEPTLQWIVSGGQTGVDRAALDFAMDNDYLHGGWAPAGRFAEDGTIPKKYQLRELETGGYRRRTIQNITDSDATLIINGGDLNGGTLETLKIAKRLCRPALLIQVDDNTIGQHAAQIVDWIQANGIVRLNVAGPRESKRPGIYRRAREILDAVRDHRISSGLERV